MSYELVLHVGHGTKMTKRYTDPHLAFSELESLFSETETFGQRGKNMTGGFVGVVTDTTTGKTVMHIYYDYPSICHHDTVREWSWNAGGMH